MELKTINDLKFVDKLDGHIVRVENLKQLAIDWIKYARRCKHPLDTPETLKTIFNVSEDDLKSNPWVDKRIQTTEISGGGR